MSKHETINYLEIPSRNLAASKAFFSAVFDWTFTDYGLEYTAFSNAGIDGGFYASDLTASTETGSVLVVFYSHNLEATQIKQHQWLHRGQDQHQHLCKERQQLLQFF